MNIKSEDYKKNGNPVQESPSPVASLELVGIDAKGALSRLKVGMKIFIKSLEAFSGSYSNFVENLENVLDNNDREKARELLHTLRGSAINLGMDSVEQSAKILGNAVKNGESELSLKIEDLKSVLDKVLAAINRLTVKS